jgi:hypothetical protein
VAACCARERTVTLYFVLSCQLTPIDVAVVQL